MAAPGWVRNHVEPCAPTERAEAWRTPRTHVVAAIAPRPCSRAEPVSCTGRRCQHDGPVPNRVTAKSSTEAQFAKGETVATPTDAHCRPDAGGGQWRIAWRMLPCQPWIPACAGMTLDWMPAFAGMTLRGERRHRHRRGRRQGGTVAFTGPTRMARAATKTGGT